MSDIFYHRLEDRGLITIAGEDRIAYLQGLVSNDVTRLSEGKAIWAALLTPQGKFRHDFFMCSWADDRILIDGEGDARMMDLGQTLRRYVLRADATLDIERTTAVFAVFGDGAIDAFGLPPEAGATGSVAGGIAFVDPRLPAMGLRVVAPAEATLGALEALGATAVDRASYDRHRIALGLPDGSRDMMPDKAILLENGFDELGGADWKKGCYMGQELTARTKYRGLVKKRLMPVSFDGDAPENGTIIKLDGREVGEMRSSCEGIGLALLRLEALEKAQETGSAFLANDLELHPSKPDWASF